MNEEQATVDGLVALVWRTLYKYLYGPNPPHINEIRIYAERLVDQAASIPEPKTKVSYMPFLGAGASTIICRSLDDVRHNSSGTCPIFKIISTDDRITSVELVKGA